MQATGQHTDTEGTSIPAVVAQTQKEGLERTAPSIQAKLTVSTPGDKYEQEADAIAAKIMAMPDSAISEQLLAPKQTNPTTAAVQRAAREDKTVSPELENRTQNATGGSPLPEAVQAFMDPRFGVDFSEIRVHRDYARATRGKDNGIIVGGNKFFIDQGRNNYVYPYTDAQCAGIIDDKGKITTTKPVIGYEYSRFSTVTLGRLLNLLTNIHENRTTELTLTAMLIASLAAEPFRYGPSHSTNLIALNNHSDSDKPAFSVMAMTTGGTDPRSSKYVRQDPKRKGTVPNEVRKRQIEIVENDSLYNRLKNYNKNASKMKESEILKKIPNMLRDYLNKIKSYNPTILEDE